MAVTDDLGDYLAVLAAELRAKGIDPATYCPARAPSRKRTGRTLAQYRLEQGMAASERRAVRARLKGPRQRLRSWVALAADRMAS